MKVDFIIAGAQKCGTTALYSFLKEHPKAIASNQKELHFFNYDISFIKGVDYYHRFFNRPKLSRLRGFKYFEASPSYISDDDINKTASRIYEYNKNIKIISLVRNPIDRAYSSWNMYRGWFFNPKEKWRLNWHDKFVGNRANVVKRTEAEFVSFERYIHNEIKVIKDGRDIEFKVLGIGKYHNGIKIFKNTFKDNYTVLKNEDLKNNTPECLEMVSSFLNLSKFDWGQFKSGEILKGAYETNMDNKTNLFLKEYYSEANSILKDITEIDYL